MIAGQHASIESLNNIREELGLNNPPLKRYLHYLNDISPISYHSNNADSYFYYNEDKYGGNTLLSSSNSCIVLKSPYLGKSFQTQQSVSSIIGKTLPNTIVLAITSILIASILGIIAGIFAAIFKDSLYDKISLLLSATGMSLPSFFAAILIGWIFAIMMGRFTGLNLTGNLYEIDNLSGESFINLKNLILPAITLGIRPLAIILQLTRNSLLDVLSQDYIRTAKAKGLTFTKIILHHALKNALNPVITAISGWFASLMAGVIFVEYIFGWKGLGTIIVNALNQQDMPLVTGCIITISIMFIITNIIVDITYSLLDPRIKQYENS